MKKNLILIFCIGLTSCAQEEKTAPIADSSVNDYAKKSNSSEVTQASSPKAKPRATKKAKAKAPKKANLPVQASSNSGSQLRLPDLLTLPGDEQLRPSPSNPSSPNKTAVIARPPKD